MGAGQAESGASDGLRTRRRAIRMLLASAGFDSFGVRSNGQITSVGRPLLLPGERQAGFCASLLMAGIKEMPVEQMAPVCGWDVSLSGVRLRAAPARRSGQWWRKWTLIEVCESHRVDPR